jgi:heterotetrameric sarcosine oxidase gamma subunit
MPVSAPEARARSPLAPGVELARCAADVVEIAALGERVAALEELAGSCGVRLAGLGRIAVGAGQLTLSVRPTRWLLLTSADAPGRSAAHWQQATAGRGAAVDLSSGLAAFVLGGPALREMLARACRLDLHADAFPQGKAAATIMVQVPVTLAAVGARLLLLTPATTARHLHEWLVTAAGPFGLAMAAEMSVNELCGAQST